MSISCSNHVPNTVYFFSSGCSSAGNRKHFAEQNTVRSHREPFQAYRLANVLGYRKHWAPWSHHETIPLGLNLVMAAVVAPFRPYRPTHKRTRSLGDVVVSIAQNWKGPSPVILHLCFVSFLFVNRLTRWPTQTDPFGSATRWIRVTKHREQPNNRTTETAKCWTPFTVSDLIFVVYLY